MPARDFRRTERLLVRVAAIDSAGLPVPVKATLLNRLRQPIRDVEAFDGEPLPGLTQFDLPLSALVPGDYALRLSVEGPSGPISEFLSFRVGG